MAENALQPLLDMTLREVVALVLGCEPEDVDSAYRWLADHKSAAAPSDPRRARTVDRRRAQPQ